MIESTGNRRRRRAAADPRDAKWHDVCRWCDGSRPGADAAVELETVRQDRDRLVAHYESRLFVMPGHFYSPLPDIDDLELRRDEIFRTGRVALPGIDLNEEDQLALLLNLAPLAEIDLPEHPVEGWRYHWRNDGFGDADGITLASVLRLWRPNRYVEVGSGWTSALALDINDRFLGGAMKTTFIDPYPERLLSGLRPEGDHVTVPEIPCRTRASRSTSPCSGRASDQATCCSSTRPHVARTGGDVVHDVVRDPAAPRVRRPRALPRHLLPVRVPAGLGVRGSSMERDLPAAGVALVQQPLPRRALAVDARDPASRPAHGRTPAGHALRRRKHLARSTVSGR